MSVKDNIGVQEELIVEMVDVVEIPVLHLQLPPRLTEAPQTVEVCREWLEHLRARFLDTDLIDRWEIAEQITQALEE